MQAKAERNKVYGHNPIKEHNWQLRQSTTPLISRVWLLLRAFFLPWHRRKRFSYDTGCMFLLSLTPVVTCLPALGAVCIFSRSWHRPPAAVACQFCRAWYRDGGKRTCTDLSQGHPTGISNSVFCFPRPFSGYLCSLNLLICSDSLA